MHAPCVQQYMDVLLLFLMIFLSLLRGFCWVTSAPASFYMMAVVVQLCFECIYGVCEGL